MLPATAGEKQASALTCTTNCVAPRGIGQGRAYTYSLSSTAVGLLAAATTGAALPARRLKAEELRRQ